MLTMASVIAALDMTGIFVIKVRTRLDVQSDKQTDRQTDRQTADRQTDRQAGRQAGRQADSHMRFLGR